MDELDGQLLGEAITAQQYTIEKRKIDEKFSNGYRGAGAGGFHEILTLVKADWLGFDTFCSTRQRLLAGFLLSAVWAGLAEDLKAGVISVGAGSPAMGPVQVSQDNCSRKIAGQPC